MQRVPDGCSPGPGTARSGVVWLNALGNRQVKQVRQVTAMLAFLQGRSYKGFEVLRLKEAAARCSVEVTFAL